MHRRITEGVFRPHTNTIKTTLTQDNKRARLEFCLSNVTLLSLFSPNPTFYDMFNVVHIYENWFYMSKPSKYQYLLQESLDGELKKGYVGEVASLFSTVSCIWRQCKIKFTTDCRLVYLQICQWLLEGKWYK
uniref:DUF7769 domain-containing protein n=1 Tax=Lactuca sativa TaxID=4236 RepID=A0A9R1WEC2_LACSA|nr:hypothetical protein LSAT_V11C100043430 [Lactuca sativa]